MPSRPNPRTIRLAVIAYNDDAELLQFVPLGTMAKPLPVGRLLEHVQARVDNTAVGEVLKFASSR